MEASTTIIMATAAVVFTVYHTGVYFMERMKEVVVRHEKEEWKKSVLSAWRR